MANRLAHVALWQYLEILDWDDRGDTRVKEELKNDLVIAV